MRHDRLAGTCDGRALALSGDHPVRLPAERDLALARGVLGRGIDENSEILVWVRAVASALLAGVVAKLTLTPTGAS